jgi:hypothetical protein
MKWTHSRKLSLAWNLITFLGAALLAYLTYQLVLYPTLSPLVAAVLDENKKGGLTSVQRDTWLKFWDGTVLAVGGWFVVLIRFAYVKLKHLLSTLIEAWPPLMLLWSTNISLFRFLLFRSKLAGFIRPIVSAAVEKSLAPLESIVHMKEPKGQTVENHPLLNELDCSKRAQVIVQKLLLRHIDSQLDALGDGGISPSKRLLITDFYSYSGYVREVTDAFRKECPNGYEVACFSTWTQPLEKWFNYLANPNSGFFARSHKTWLAYLNYWAPEGRHGCIRMERSLLHTGKVEFKGAGLLTEERMLQGANSWLLINRSVDTDTDTPDKLMLGQKEIVLLQKKLARHTLTKALDFVSEQYGALLSADRCFLILPADVISEVELTKIADTFEAKPLKTVFSKMFHRAFPSRRSACNLKFVDEGQVARMTRRSPEQPNLPEDLFMLGLLPIDQSSGKEPLWIFGLGSDLEPGVNGLAVEFFFRGQMDFPHVEKDEKNTASGEKLSRWDQITGWVNELRTAPIESLL